MTTLKATLLSFRSRPHSLRFGSAVILLFGVLLSLLSISRPAAGTPRAAAREKKPEKPYALIFGTVWGPSGQPVYGVKVKLRRADQKKAKWELVSDHNGEFAQRVPAGQADYLVWTDLKGYKPQDGKHLQAAEEVKVHIENDERADIGLHLK